MHISEGGGVIVLWSRHIVVPADYFPSFVNDNSRSVANLIQAFQLQKKKKKKKKKIEKSTFHNSGLFY